MESDVDPIHPCRCAECYCAFPLPYRYHPDVCPRCLDGDHMNTDYALPVPVLETVYMRRLEASNGSRA